MDSKRLNIEKIRGDFPITKEKVNGRPLIYLDTAATSQKPIQVIRAISGYYEKYNSNVQNRQYPIVERATEEFEGSKKIVAKFIGANSDKSIVYTKNATEAINLVALSWGSANIGKGDTILLTEMEHHANIVPWQILAKRTGANLKFVKLKDSKFIDIEHYVKLLSTSPKIVSFGHVSNVLGTINPAKEMIKLAHEQGAVVMVDGAQAVPHFKVDISDLNADFYALSAHKMLGPAGIGVLYGKEELLDNMEPILGGGHMSERVSKDNYVLNEVPWKFEAGTANIEGAIGFSAAINYLNRLSMKKVRDYDIELSRYALERLGGVPGIKIYGPDLSELDRKVGVIAFNLKGKDPYAVSTRLGSEGIAIRAGVHAAMPLVNGVFKEKAVCRMSFYIYNNKEEIDSAVNCITNIAK